MILGDGGEERFEEGFHDLPALRCAGRLKVSQKMAKRLPYGHGTLRVCEVSQKGEQALDDKLWAQGLRETIQVGEIDIEALCLELLGEALQACWKLTLFVVM